MLLLCISFQTVEGRTDEVQSVWDLLRCSIKCITHTHKYSVFKQSFCLCCLCIKLPWDLHIFTLLLYSVMVIAYNYCVIKRLLLDHFRLRRKFKVIFLYIFPRNFRFYCVLLYFSTVFNINLLLTNLPKKALSWIGHMFAHK